ncbi:MAG: diguanylate cyclase domain-containing protein, partial [Granulosicoccaceae bacterium]
MDSSRQSLQCKDQRLLALEPDALLWIGAKGQIIDAHPGQGACQELFSRSSIGLKVKDTLPEPFSALLLSILNGCNRRQISVKEISWQDRSFEVSSRHATEGGLQVMIRDITLYKAAENTMRELAYHDGLTGLPNRSFFKQNFEAAIETARHNGKHVCVLFIDLDRFKRINDTLGHNVGDELLVEVAERLRRCIRASDLMLSLSPESVARLGGDEFTIVAGNLDSTSDIKVLAQRLLDSLAKPVQLAQHELTVTPSIGISIYPNDGDDVDTLLKHADVAMYHAKNQGRNNYQFFSATMNEKTHRRLTLESQLRVAIENGDLHLEYQPQIDLQSNQVVAVESLARWNHSELGTITPDVFIPAAEESGLIVPLGDMLMELGCRQLQQWQEIGLNDFRLAMNFSGLQFRRDHIVNSLQRLLSS